MLATVVDSMRESIHAICCDFLSPHSRYTERADLCAYQKKLNGRPRHGKATFTLEILDFRCLFVSISLQIFVVLCHKVRFQIKHGGQTDRLYRNYPSSKRSDKDV